jgi:hypothetical protein
MASDLIGRVDAALYFAKHEGRNRVADGSDVRRMAQTALIAPILIVIVRWISALGVPSSREGRRHHGAIDDRPCPVQTWISRVLTGARPSCHGECPGTAERDLVPFGSTW